MDFEFLIIELRGIERKKQPGVGWHRANAPIPTAMATIANSFHCFMTPRLPFVICSIWGVATSASLSVLMQPATEGYTERGTKDEGGGRAAWHMASLFASSSTWPISFSQSGESESAH